MDETTKALFRMVEAARRLLDECDEARMGKGLRTFRQKAIAKEIRRFEEMVQ